VIAFFRPLLEFIFHLGYFAPLAMGVLDSSFLVLPFGNDLVIIALVSRRHGGMPLYVLSAACGSTLGVLLLALVARKLGEEGIRKVAGANRFKKMQTAFAKRGALDILLASLAPPPFPFTMVIATAAALDYPQTRILGVNFLGRALRFTILGFLAIRFGRQVLEIENSSIFRWSMAILIALCVIASGLSIWSWVKHTRSSKKGK
jgi:membrane protein YqaA with SNARE-associated domain